MILRAIVTCVLIFLNLVAFSQDDKPMTLKDSITSLIPFEEYLKMDLYERLNFKRKMRGQLPIFERKLETHDRNGIEVVRDYDEEKALQQVRSRYGTIEKEKRNYRQEVFPNAYRDAVEYVFGPFYKNILTRELSYTDYKNLEGQNHDGEYDINGAMNHTKRTYYFNENNELRLIEIIHQIDVNEGEKYGYEETIAKIGYDKKWYYVWGDSLQFYYNIYQRSKIKGGHVHFEDTLTADGSSKRKYFYRHNCFKSNLKEGEFDYANWEKNLESSEAEKSYPNTDEVIEFRNLVLEYQEYQEGKNDYLQPVEHSFVKKPYVVVSKE